ncbi:hypothetical protein AX16_006941 [Volvariella volvacea WC 439]|nr:hypothetical protein AX16_006941 [Volvariella volvacea WC 439]
MSSSQPAPILLPSSPPSPAPSDDDRVSHLLAPSDDNDPEAVDTLSPPPTINKGKAKQYGGYIPGSQSQEALNSPVEHGSYPPMTDEEAETRRVEETLRRWEIAERAKRKAARESQNLGYDSTVTTPKSTSIDSSASPNPNGTSTRATSEELYSSAASIPAAATSFIAGVTRKASLLLSGKRSSETSSSAAPIPLSDAEAGVPLQAIPASPSTPYLNSARNSAERSSPRGENPFSDEAGKSTTTGDASLTTPTAATFAASIPTKGSGPAAITAEPSPATAAASTDRETAGGAEDDNTHLKVPKKKRSSKPPPPAPLPIPPPRTPPPIDRIPQMVPDNSRELNRNGPQPRQRQQQDDEEKEVKWWHEWLCGCGEGKDRGGDYQAGRTNPFE